MASRVSLHVGIGRMRFSTAVVLLAASVAASCRPPGPSPHAGASSDPRTLRIVMGLNVATLDPQVPWDQVSSVVLDNIFDSLVRFDRSFRLTSGLALRWINPDDRTWRFYLDPEARFPDGSALRSSDVKFSIERLRSLAGSQMTGFTRHIASTEIVDDLTVDVHTDIPMAILNSLAFIPIMSEKHVRAAGDKVAEQPFGTGAYSLVRWEKGKSIVLEANAHHRPQPEVRRVEFLIREDLVKVDDLVGLRPDIALYLRSATVVELQKRKVPGLQMVSGEGLAVFYVVLNLRDHLPGSKGPNPFRDVRVRRALAHAVDQEELVREGALGFGHTATQLIVPPVFGYDPGIAPVKHDPEAARRLLAEAGHPRIDVTLETLTGGSHRLDNVLLAQWAGVGVRGALRELPDDAFQRALESGDFTTAIVGYSCTSADASELLNFNLHTPDAARGYGFGNYAGWSHPELDRIAEENLKVFDPRKRLGMLQKALRIAAQELPVLPVYVQEDLYVVSDAVVWSPPINEEVRIEDMSLRKAPGS